MNKINKKATVGMVWNVIIALLVGIVALIILTVFLQSTGEAAERLQEDVMCKISVAEAVRSGDWWGDVIQCPTKYHELTKVSEEEVKKLIAKRSIACWDKFGRGEKLLFAHDPKMFGTDKAAYCNVCDVFEFKKVKPISGFGTYLLEHNVSSYYSKEPISQFEFLNRVKLESNEKTELKNTVLSQVGVDTEKSYAIVFIYTKDPKFFSIKYFLDEASKNYLLAKVYFNSFSYAFGDDELADWDARIALVPYKKSQLQKACEYLEE